MSSLRDLVDEGLTIKEIAAELSIGVDAVKYRIKRDGLQTAQGKNRSTTGVDKDKRRRRQVVYNNARRQEFKQRAVAYLGGSCSKCGYARCLKALEFHHMDPLTKDFEVSKDSASRTWEKVEKELDKCILVCANCHREIHDSLIA